MRGRLEASPYLWRFAAAEIGAAVAGLLADGRAVAAGAARRLPARRAGRRAAPPASAAAGRRAPSVPRPARCSP